MNKRIRSILAAVLAAAMLTGCSAQTQEPQMKIYVICKSQDPYWDTTKAGALEAGEEMNLDVIYEAPASEEEIDTQIQMINDALADGAQAIVLAPLDTDELNDTLRNAVSQNVPVLTIDSDVSFTGRRACLSTQNLSAGAIAARAAAEMIGGEGEVGIICHKADAQTAIERMGGFVDELSGKSADTVPDAPRSPEGEMPEGNPPEGERPEGEKPAETSADQDNAGYPDITIAETKYCEGNVDLSREGAIQLITEHPDLKAIYATNQPGTVGVCQAIDQLGMQDQITVVGFDYFDGADAYIESGVLDAVISQNPYNMGYLGVRYARKLVEGGIVESNVDTGATLITKDNLNDEDIRWLVNPTGK